MRIPSSPLKSIAVALLIITASAASCKHDGTNAGVTNPASAAAVKAQLDVLRDSVDLKWRAVDESDVQLLGTTGLLLKELKSQPTLDAAKVQALNRANTRLRARRYTRQSMTSAQIDLYDAAQDSLLHAIYPVAAPNGNAPSETIRNFVEGIQQTDAGVVGVRIQYDKAAHQYNDYLKLHQAELQSLGGKYKDLQPLPVFELQL